MALALGPRALAADYGLMAYDAIGSTNAEALAAVRGGARRSTWFVTTEQTAGRGRRSRAWIAPRGNLASSVLEVIDAAPSVAATLGFAAGVALERALREVSFEAAARGGARVDYTLKWPNDVLGNKHKLSGILLEAEALTGGGLAVVVGIGTNVVAAPEGTPHPATSLRALGVDIGAEDLFAALSDAWAECFGIWNNGRGFDEIRRLWLERAAGIGGPVSIQSGSSTVAGTFETLDAAGCMVIAAPSGRREAIAAGDVYFGAVASTGSK
ncbi:MAG: biotin--[acetyl-CoA-carboxylase] ligase [Xanthobacteraceae bacterium]|nr:biotin--[acetyl-CoA-carboxylase] ligase [Xanthobacteraceae bacterium]